MRIGISAFGISSGKSKGDGISVYTKNLTKYLSIIDQNNKYYVFVSNESKELFENIKNNSFKIIVVNLKENIVTRLFYDNLILPALYYIYRVDVMHCSSSRMPFTLFGNYVVTVYDLMYKYYQEHFPQCMNKIKMYYFDINMKIIVKKAKKIIAISEYTKGDILKYFKNADHNRIEVVYGGVDQMVFLCPESSKFTGNNEKYILTITSTSPHKNIEVLIKSYILACKRYNILHNLIVAGNAGLCHNEFLKMIKNKNMDRRIIFLENISEEHLLNLYRGADLFMFLSLNEGFGLPVLEAMASGVPVICSNKASLPEVAGNAAILVEPNDVDSITEKMYMCITDTKQRLSMIDKGKLQAKRFSWERAAAQVQNIYSE